MTALRIVGGLLGLMLVAGCAAPEGSEPPIGSEEIPIEDVGDGLSIDTSADRKEAAPAARLAGVLPEDFPRDLPLHLPASVVELETGRSATFLTAAAPGVVREDLLGRLRAAGWSVDGSDGAWTAGVAGRTVRLRIEDARPGTRYRWEW